MSIKHIAAQFIASGALVDKNGVPTTYGLGFLQALLNRTGGGTGIVPVVLLGLNATGTTLATALALTADWNQITGGSGGVVISAALNMQPGNDIWVANDSGTNKNVYPPSSAAKIDALGAGAPFVLSSGKLRCFQCWSSTIFKSYGN